MFAHDAILQYLNGTLCTTKDEHGFSLDVHDIWQSWLQNKCRSMAEKCHTDCLFILILNPTHPFNPG